jgi:hypothetical protein
MNRRQVRRVTSYFSLNCFKIRIKASIFIDISEASSSEDRTHHKIKVHGVVQGQSITDYRLRGPG